MPIKGLSKPTAWMVLLVFSAASASAAPIATEVVIAPSVYAKASPETIIMNPTEIDIPFDFVTLKEVHRGTNGRLIIHIQDAHANLSGQQNLASTLDHFMKRYEMPLVLVEGGDRDVTLDEVKKVASQDDWRIVAKRFLYDGVISGEEYLNLVSDHPMRIMGIEYPDLYSANLDAYAKLAGKRQEILVYLHKNQISLDRVKNKLYPKELLSYEEAGKKGGKEDEVFKTAIDALLGLSHKAGIALESEFLEVVKLERVQEREKTIAFAAANAEQAKLVSELAGKGAAAEIEQYAQASKRVANARISQYVIMNRLFDLADRHGVSAGAFQELAKYREYLKEFAELRLDILLEEIVLLEDRVYDKLLPSDDARKIRAIDRFLGLLYDAHSIKMSSRQFAEYKANEALFPTVSWQAFLNEKLKELGFYEDMVPYKPLFEDAAEALGNFYAVVDLRDFAFLENTNRVMAEQGQGAAFLVAGGYHTQHLTMLLREQGFSYVVLTPIVTFETDHARYEEILLAPLRLAEKKKAAAIARGEKIPETAPSAVQVGKLLSGEDISGENAALTGGGTKYGPLFKRGPPQFATFMDAVSGSRNARDPNAPDPIAALRQSLENRLPVDERDERLGRLGAGLTVVLDSIVREASVEEILGQLNGAMQGALGETPSAAAPDVRADLRVRLATALINHLYDWSEGGMGGELQNEPGLMAAAAGAVALDNVFRSTVGLDEAVFRNAVRDFVTRLQPGPAAGARVTEQVTVTAELLNQVRQKDFYQVPPVLVIGGRPIHLNWATMIQVSESGAVSSSGGNTWDLIGRLASLKKGDVFTLSYSDEAVQKADKIISEIRDQAIPSLTRRIRVITGKEVVIPVPSPRTPLFDYLWMLHSRDIDPFLDDLRDKGSRKTLVGINVNDRDGKTDPLVLFVRGRSVDQENSAKVSVFNYETGELVTPDAISRFGERAAPVFQITPQEMGVHLVAGYPHGRRLNFVVRRQPVTDESGFPVGMTTVISTEGLDSLDPRWDVSSVLAREIEGNVWRTVARSFGRWLGEPGDDEWEKIMESNLPDEVVRTVLDDEPLKAYLQRIFDEEFNKKPYYEEALKNSQERIAEAIGPGPAGLASSQEEFISKLRELSEGDRARLAQEAGSRVTIELGGGYRAEVSEADDKGKQWTEIRGKTYKDGQEIPGSDIRIIRSRDNKTIWISRFYPRLPRGTGMGTKLLDKLLDPSKYGGFEILARGSVDLQGAFKKLSGLTPLTQRDDAGRLRALKEEARTRFAGDGPGDRSWNGFWRMATLHGRIPVAGSRINIFIATERGVEFPVAVNVVTPDDAGAFGKNPESLAGQLRFQPGEEVARTVPGTDKAVRLVVGPDGATLFAGDAAQPITISREDLMALARAPIGERPVVVGEVPLPAAAVLPSVSGPLGIENALQVVRRFNGTVARVEKPTNVVIAYQKNALAGASDADIESVTADFAGQKGNLTIDVTTFAQSAEAPEPNTRYVFIVDADDFKTGRVAVPTGHTVISVEKKGVGDQFFNLALANMLGIGFAITEIATTSDALKFNEDTPLIQRPLFGKTLTAPAAKGMDTFTGEQAVVNIIVGFPITRSLTRAQAVEQAKLVAGAIVWAA